MLTTLRFLVILCIAGGIFAAETSPFEGKWKLDKKKTQAVGAPEDLEFEIERNGNSELLIKSKYREPKNNVYPMMWLGIMTYELPLSMDGTKKVNQIGPFAHASKTRVEGNQLITDWSAAVENGTLQGQWIRTLSADGKEMTIQVISKASDGRNMDQTLVFRRR